MPKEKAPAGGANIKPAYQGVRIIEYLKENGTLNVLEGRAKLSILNISQRISEQIKRHRQPIQKAWVVAKDESGVTHRVRIYIWRGESSHQQDMFGGW